MTQYSVGVLMGSDSDYEVMKACLNILKEFDIPFEAHVLSAHRTPDAAHDFAKGAYDKGMRVIICGAGAAAHLAGVIAASTVLPVIGVPLDATALRGVDALYATVQMPGGIPVATMGIGKSGAMNAGLSAVSMLAMQDSELYRRLLEYRSQMTAKVAAKDAKLQLLLAAD